MTTNMKPAMKLTRIFGLALAVMVLMTGCRKNVISGDDQLMFSKFFGGQLEDSTTFAINTADGGYLISGATQDAATFDGTFDAMMIKTDASGNEEWSRRFIYRSDTSRDEIANSILQLSDGGFLLVGEAANENEDKDLLMIRTDANGDTIWKKMWGVNQWDEVGVAAVETIEGRIAVVSKYRDVSTGEQSILLTRFTMQAEFVDSNIYNFAGLDFPVGITQTSTSHLYITGTTNRLGNADFWLIKADSLGNETWYNYYPTYEGGDAAKPNQDVLFSSSFISDGILMVGFARESGGAVYSRVVKTDYEGDTIWNYVGPVGTEARTVVEHADGRIAIAGTDSRAHGANGFDSKFTRVWIQFLDQATGDDTGQPTTDSSPFGGENSTEYPVTLLTNPDFTLTMAGTSEFKTVPMVWLARINPANF